MEDENARPMSNFGVHGAALYDAEYASDAGSLYSQKGSATNLAGSAHWLTITTAALLLVPWVMFFVIMTVFTHSYRHTKWLAWVVVVLFALISIAFMWIHSRPGGRPRYYLFMGMLCTLAVFFSTVIGICNYYQHMQGWHIYNESRHYENVLSAESPEAKTDAGKIHFSVDTYVDPTRSVGFESGKQYCVAPVLSDATDREVGYWAAGTDCCRHRGRFDCDDAWNEKAHSGFVIMDTSPLRKAALPQFQKAAEEAAAVYDYSLPDKLIFLRWVQDLPGMHAEMWSNGQTNYFIAIFVYLFASMVAGSGVHIYSHRKVS